jgi:uncharacterized protein
MRYWLSRHQAQRILAAESAGKGLCHVSLDLGRSKSKVVFRGETVVFPDGQALELRIVKQIAKDQVCSMIAGSEALRLQFFKTETNRMYRLVATGEDTAPTSELGGFRMHRVKDVDPMADTNAKIRAIWPVKGCRILDTCTGLGYTAISAIASGASEVVTVEVDGGMVAIREANPWSSRLSDERIVKVSGDVKDEVSGFGDSSFDAIIHDPPSMKIAGELYSLEFYSQLCRVLKAGGMLFHYVGAPGSKYRKKNPARGVIERLRAAGFTEVAENQNALGVNARK